MLGGIGNRYKYLLKLGSFEASDILTTKACGNTRVMAASMQVIKGGRMIKGQIFNSPDPSTNETRNVLLKKVSMDPETSCKF